MLWQPKKKKKKKFDRQKLNFCGKFKAILSTIYICSNCKQSVCKGVSVCIAYNKINLTASLELCKLPQRKLCENIRNCFDAFQICGKYFQLIFRSVLSTATKPTCIVTQH